MRFVMAGGGTGGHVIPALAVAAELRARGHEVLFIGTRTGMEAKLVPQAGHPIEWIEIGGLKRVGLLQTARTLVQLPLSVLRCRALLRRYRPQAIFSMGGYVAGPVMLAALLARIPQVVMEPNAMPGFTSRWMGRYVERALLNFAETARWFRPDRSEVTGMPIRDAFFTLVPRPWDGTLHVLVTGGSRGSRRLNNATRDAWPALAQLPVRLLHQTGTEDHAALAAAFPASGVQGAVQPFLPDMPQAFADAHLVVARSGAGSVSELCAAGRPAILVPFPFAADDHQRQNAAALARAGAAVLIADQEFTGARLVTELRRFLDEPGLLSRMGQAARGLAKAGAARRAADVLEEVGHRA